MDVDSKKTVRITTYSNSWIILGFLLGVPLLIAGALSINILLSERENFEIQRSQVEINFLHQVESELKNTFGSLIQGVLKQLEETTVDAPVGAIRRLIYSNELQFAVIYQGERQIFPPDDTNAIFVSEKAVLEKLHVSLQTARKHLRQGESYQTLIRLKTPNDDSFLHCQPAINTYNVCVLLGGGQIKSSIITRFKQLSEQYPNWSFKLTNMEGGVLAQSPLILVSDYFSEIRLSPPLHDWVLMGGLQQRSSSSFHLPPLLFTIIFPLLISWAIAVLVLYRHQQQRVIENEQRSKLASQLSHELRTPIANLALYTDLIKRCANDVERVQQYAQVLQDETDRLERVSRSAIAVAQGKSRNIQQQTVKPDHVLETLLIHFRVLFERRGCQVLFSGHASTAIVFDVTALESIVIQLLDNACKYGGHGVIDLTTTLTERDIIISIRDYGAGIPEGQHELIFQANYRCDERKTDGFGVGLATARQLARLNGGDIRVEKVNPGALFVATLRYKESE